jgi:hypothetical protein
MAEEKAETEPQRALGLEADWFLQYLIGHVNKDPDLNIPLTLLVGGSCVTGRAISGPEYFKLLGNTILGKDGEGASLFQPLIDQMYPPDFADRDIDSIGYIHLKDARVFQGSVQIPANFRGNLWRGKLTAVDGLIFGELGVGALPPTQT